MNETEIRELETALNEYAPKDVWEAMSEISGHELRGNWTSSGTTSGHIPLSTHVVEGARILDLGDDRYSLVATTTSPGGSVCDGLEVTPAENLRSLVATVLDVLSKLHAPIH